MSILTYSYKKDKNLKLNDYFTVGEFIANNTALRPMYDKGNYDEVKIDSDLVDYLYRIRRIVNKPIIITSGYRPVAYNSSNAVKGATNSYHCKGMAVDIICNGVHPIQLAYIAKELGINGIGVYAYSNDSSQGFIHIDTRLIKYFWLSTNKLDNYKSIIKVMPDIKQGDTGYAVKIVQRKLGITTDGIFGNITRKTLIDRYGKPNMTDEMWKRVFK